MCITLEQFQAALAAANSPSEIANFCRKHVLHGTPHVFENRENDFYEFRSRIAQRFEISFHEVIITGSAHLGFSPHKNTLFSLDSDIDVALVSEKLFEEFIEIARSYQMQLRGARRSITVKEQQMYHEFLEYTVLGWIRPDKLPTSFQVNSTKDGWFDFFKSISYDRSEVGNYKVAGGVFRSYRHLELYTISGIQGVRETLTLPNSK
jgi:hypothetical protein